MITEYLRSETDQLNARHASRHRRGGFFFAPGLAMAIGWA